MTLSSLQSRSEMASPIFLTGLARGGTNLLARMLIAGGASQVAIHAFQPWFKSLRNAMVAHGGNTEIVKTFDPESPFADGHFDALQLKIQDILHSSGIDLPFADAEWPVLHERLQARASHDAADLCPGLASLSGCSSYRRMMDRMLALILNRHAADTRLVGLIDTWIIDLFPALARAYPDARFLVVIRDPRAIVASQLKFLETDPPGVGHILSILRQWRKYVALASEFERQPLFNGRLKLVRFEDQVAGPEQFAIGLCRFLDLAYTPTMIDFSRYEDQAHTRKWAGNSAFAAGLDRIDPAPAQRWRSTLAPGALAATEFCCGADMAICGYNPVKPLQGDSKGRTALEFLVEDGARASSWRTDTGDASLEFDRETFRRELLSGSRYPDKREIREAFLSVGYFNLLKSGTRLFPESLLDMAQS